MHVFSVFIKVKKHVFMFFICKLMFLKYDINQNVRQKFVDKWIELIGN